MKPAKLNTLFRLVDILLDPFMWILGRFTFPLQETHAWHVKKQHWLGRGLSIKGTDSSAKFGHKCLFGHMPILGGLTKYAVIEAKGYNNYWYIGWSGSIHLLPIKQSRIKLLVGKGGYEAYGLGDTGQELKLKIAGYGKLGDGKFEGIRLF